MVVEGVAGIGKTALVRRFLERIPDARVLAADADEMEVDLEYGVTEQLLGRGHSGAAEVDPLGVGGDLITALATSGDHPVVLIVDDLHWTDDASMRALTFALRRTRDQPVVAVLTTRPEGVPRIPPGVRRLTDAKDGAWLLLEGLSAPDVRTLAAAYGHNLTAHDAEVVQAHTEGNPLYVRALLAEYADGALVEGLRGPLPAPSTFAAVIFSRLMRCSRDVENLVAAAAVLGDRVRVDEATRLAAIGEPLRALDDAVEAGLLEWASTEVHDELRWPHPLVRSAIYHDLAPGRRAVLHHAAAEVVDDPRIALRHRIAGAYGPDDEVARDAELWAIEEVGRGMWSAAQGAFLNASRLSTTPLDRQNRLLAAIASGIAAGDLQRARRLYERSGDLGDGAGALLIAGTLAESERQPEARQLLEKAWEAVDADATPDLATRIASALASHHTANGDAAAALTWSEKAIDISGGRPMAGADPVTTYLRALGAAGRAEEGLDLLAQRPELVAGDDEEWPRGWLGRGTLRLWTDDLDGATADLSRVVEVTRWKGPSGFCVAALATLADTDYRAGRWDDALGHAQLALSIAADGHLTGLERIARVTVAVPLASRADRPAVEELLKPLIESAAGEASGAFLLYALALLADAEDRPRWIVRTLAPLAAVADFPTVHDPGPLPWEDLYALSLIRTGDPAAADAYVKGALDAAFARHLPSAMARATRTNAALLAAQGDSDGAARALAESAEIAAGLPMPFLRAQIDLDYGASLRRSGQRKQAGEHLESARAGFEALGATTYTARCEGELAAADLGRRVHRDTDANALTPAEQAVVRLVADGASNKEVAAALVVSVRTVETHLTRIYRKIGVKSRAQLVAKMRDTTT